MTALRCKWGEPGWSVPGRAQKEAGGELSLPFSPRNDALLGLSSTRKLLCQLRGSLCVNDLLNHPARKLGNLGGSLKIKQKQFVIVHFSDVNVSS